MQRLYPAAEHFWPAGEFRDVADGEAGIAERFGASTRGEDFNAQGRELFGEVHYSCFVENADERALHRHLLPPEK